MRQTMAAVLMIGLLGLFLAGVSACARNPLRAERSPGPDPAAADTAAGSFLSLYSRWLSPVDGDRCAMYPTCSQYSRQAFDRHGLLSGWILTCDRLLRCGRDELSLAPIIIVDGQRRCHDSLEANDYWWEE